jgi:hypothetical protein
MTTINAAGRARRYSEMLRLECPVYERQITMTTARWSLAEGNAARCDRPLTGQKLTL